MKFKYVRKSQDSSQPDLFTSFRSVREEVQVFMDFWNGHIWLPKIIGTDRQCQFIKHALQRSFFRDNYRQALVAAARSEFLRKKMKPKFNMDWFLVNDNFDKIMEGKYSEDTLTNETHTASLDNEGNEIIT